MGGTGSLSGVKNVSALQPESDVAGWGYCAVLTSGGVDCWGDDQGGELGDGNLLETDRIANRVSGENATPVSVEGVGGMGTLSGVKSVSGDGNLSYCAVLDSGGVDCWAATTVGIWEMVLLPSSAITGTCPAVPSRYPQRESRTPSTFPAARSPVLRRGQSVCCLSSGGVDCWGANGWGALWQSGCPLRCSSRRGSWTRSASELSGITPSARECGLRQAHRARTR